MLFLNTVISVKYPFWHEKAGLEEEPQNGSFIFLFYRTGIVNNPLLLADALMGEGAYQTTQALMWLLCVVLYLSGKKSYFLLFSPAFLLSLSPSYDFISI